MTHEPLEPPHNTDLGNAERFARDHRDCVRYVHAWRRWLVWDDRRWAPDETGAVIRLAKLTVKAIYAEAAYAERKDERAQLAAHATRSEAERRIAAMLALATSEPGIAVTPDQLDTDAYLLNTLSGTVDLRTGELRPHRRDDLITRLVPVVYNPAAPCPQWVAFLHRIFGGDAALIAFVQRAIGYGLTGDTREQCFFSVAFLAWVWCLRSPDGTGCVYIFVGPTTHEDPLRWWVRLGNLLPFELPGERAGLDFRTRSRSAALSRCKVVVRNGPR